MGIQMSYSVRNTYTVGSKNGLSKLELDWGTSWLFITYLVIILKWPFIKSLLYLYESDISINHCWYLRKWPLLNELYIIGTRAQAVRSISSDAITQEVSRTFHGLVIIHVQQGSVYICHGQFQLNVKSKGDLSLKVKS